MTPQDWLDKAESATSEADKREALQQVLAHAESTLWEFIGAALIFSGGLDDHSGAKRALERCQDTLKLHEPGKTSDWCFLGEACREILDEDESVARCLTEAERCAAGIDDLCQLAKSHTQLLGDKKTAMRFLKSAETQAATATDRDSGKNEVQPYWAISRVYMEAFEDEEAARASLDTGLARADSVGACTTLAHAWSCLVDDVPQADPVRTCLELGETLAGSHEDWWELCEAYHDVFEKGGPGMRRCLERARDLATDIGSTRRVADAYRYRLGDDQSADAIAEIGLHPAALTGTGQQNLGWERDPESLFTWLRKRTTPGVLQSIAQADRGNDYEKHLGPLQAIAKTGLVPHPLDWYPLEVLQLAHWSGPKGSTLEKAFCSTVLLLDCSGPEWGSHDGEASTTPILLDSCLELGPETLDGFIGLLVTLSEAVQNREQEYPEDQVFALLGILFAATVQNPDDPRLSGLVEEILSIETRMAENLYKPRRQHGWLFRYVIMLESSRKLWRVLARRILGAATQADPTRTHLAELLALMDVEDA